MLYPVTDVRYAFGYVGGASTPAASVKTLTAAGPLLISKEHRLATWLPEAFDDITHTPAVATTQQWIHSMIFGSLIYDTDIANGGMHFAVGGSRLAKLIKDIDESGFDWTPLAGKLHAVTETAGPMLKKAIAKLPSNQRALAAADVMYDNTDHAATGTFYDFVTPSLLMANGGGAEMLSHFVGITPGAYVKSGAPGARMHSDFKDNIAQILGSVGRDVSTLSGKAQAAAVIVWLDKTNPPPEITHYVQVASLEIERRKRNGCDVSKCRRPCICGKLHVRQGSGELLSTNTTLHHRRVYDFIITVLARTRSTLRSLYTLYLKA